MQLEIYGAAHTKVGVAEEQTCLYNCLTQEFPLSRLFFLMVCIKREKGLVHFIAWIAQIATKVDREGVVSYPGSFCGKEEMCLGMRLGKVRGGGGVSLVERTSWKPFLVASVQPPNLHGMKWKTGLLERIPTTVSVNTATYIYTTHQIAKCILLQGFLTWEWG